MDRSGPAAHSAGDMFAGAAFAAPAPLPLFFELHRHLLAALDLNASRPPLAVRAPWVSGLFAEGLVPEPFMLPVRNDGVPAVPWLSIDNPFDALTRSRPARPQRADVGMSSRRVGRPSSRRQFVVSRGQAAAVPASDTAVSMTSPPSFPIVYAAECPWCTPALFDMPRFCRPDSKVEGALILDLIAAGLHIHGNRPVCDRWPDAVIPMSRLIVEYDSHRYHHSPEATVRDLDKQRRWESAGYRVMRVREPGLERTSLADLLLASPYSRLDEAGRNGVITAIVASARRPRPDVSLQRLAAW